MRDGPVDFTEGGAVAQLRRISKVSLLAIGIVATFVLVASKASGCDLPPPEWSAREQVVACLEAAEQGNTEIQYHLGKVYAEGRLVDPDVDLATEWLLRATRRGHKLALAYLADMFSGGEFSEEKRSIVFEELLSHIRQTPLENISSQIFFALSRSYYQGWHADQDISEAVHLLQLAAGREHVDAQYVLGMIYADREFIGKNGDEARYWLEKAAKNNHPVAQFELGKMFAAGKWDLENNEKAFGLLLSSARQGQDEAQTYLARMLSKPTPFDLTNEQRQKIIDELLEWARFHDSDLGNAQAQYELGRLYANGQLESLGGNADPEIFWFYQAAGQSHRDALEALESLTTEPGGRAEAQFRLGELYEMGWGVEKDHSRAFELYRLAKGKGSAGAISRLTLEDAHSGDADAQFRKGRQLEHSDIHAALLWYQKASDQGHVDAQLALGSIYAEGRHEIPRDCKLAYTKWYKRAAHNGHPDAQFALARRFESPRFGYNECWLEKRNMPKAIDWYERSASQGHVPSQLSLARIYDRGEGIDKNESVAFGWYTKAAERKDPTAEYELGVRYLFGVGGVQKNAVVAADWFQKAVEKRHSGASYYLGLQYATGNGVDKNEAKSDILFRNVPVLSRAQLGISFYCGRDGIREDWSQAEQHLRLSVSDGFVSSLPSLATLYMESDNKAIDTDVGSDHYEVAKVLLDSAAKRGSMVAYFWLAAMHAQGLGMTTNEMQSVAWLQRAVSEFGVTENIMERLYAKLGKIPCRQREHYERILHTIEQMIDVQSGIPQYLLALHSLANENERTETFALLQGSAERGFVPAASALGFLICMDANEKCNNKWTRSAANLGDRHAQYDLFSYYAKQSNEAFWKGTIDKNSESALEWLRKAAKSGNITAQVELGRMYIYRGFGPVDLDRDLGTRWLEEAAGSGSVSALSELSRIYYDRSRTADSDEALKAYRTKSEIYHRAWVAQSRTETFSLIFEKNSALQRCADKGHGCRPLILAFGGVLDNAAVRSRAIGPFYKYSQDMFFDVFDTNVHVKFLEISWWDSLPAQDNTRSDAVDYISRYMEKNPDAPIIVIGHSRGGQIAHDVVSRLNGKIEIDVLITLDAFVNGNTLPLVKPDNVALWLNYHRPQLKGVKWYRSNPFGLRQNWWCNGVIPALAKGIRWTAVGAETQGAENILSYESHCDIASDDFMRSAYNIIRCSIGECANDVYALIDRHREYFEEDRAVEHSRLFPSGRVGKIRRDHAVWEEVRRVFE